MPNYNGFYTKEIPATETNQERIVVFPGDGMDTTNGGIHSKLGMDFIGIPAEALAALARIIDEGARTHHDPDGSNWRKIPVETHLNHAFFHINAWQRGVVGEDHLGHAMCRLVMAFTVENGG